MIYSFLGQQDICFITQTVYLVPPIIYNMLGEKLSVWCNSYPAPLECTRSWVKLNKLYEWCNSYPVPVKQQDICFITQTVYLVPPIIYNMLGEHAICYITQTVYLVRTRSWVKLNKLSGWCNSYSAPLECYLSWVELNKLSVWCNIYPAPLKSCRS
jgi:hypothetical protein